MTPFQGYYSCAIGVLFVCGTGCFGQCAPVETGAKPDVTPTPSLGIKPEARGLMEKMVTTYQNLKSYSGGMERSQGIREENETSPIIYTWVKFRRPNLISIITKYGSYTVKAVCNGTTLFAANSKERSRYLKVGAPAGPKAFEKAFYEGDAFGGLGLEMVLSGDNPLHTFDSVLTGLSFGVPDTIDGVAVETIVVKIGTEVNGQEITYYIGRDDFLLRRVRFVWPVAVGRTLVVTETYYGVKPNPSLPSSTFVFTPPPRAKSVKTLN